LATGSKPNKWMARTRFTGRNGLYHKQDLEALERWAPTTKRAVIVGGGLIGIELAEMRSAISCHSLVREKFWDGVLPLAKAK
jgi:NAD(P)H-nitrite reductase large subunit